MSRAAVLAVVASLILLSASQPARAAWLPNGNPIAKPTGDQDWAFVASDDRGGAFVTWAQYGSVRAQHMTANGDAAVGWPAVGIVVPPTAVMGGAPWRIDPVASVSDGEGGFYIVTLRGGSCMIGCSSGEPARVYVNRITAAGTVARGWPSDGVQVEASPLSFNAPSRVRVVSSGRSGLLVSWTVYDYVEWVPVNTRLVAQTIRPDGSLPWGEIGVELASGPGVRVASALASDGEGGALAFWADQGTDSTLRLRSQHVSSRGRLEWRSGGITIANANVTDFSGPLAVSDGEHGAIVEWQGSERGRAGLLAARVTGDGRLPWRHHTVLSAAAGMQTGLRMIAAANGGAIASWLDTRNGVDSRVYAQRVDNVGEVLWGPAATLVCRTPGLRGALALASDGRDGAYIAWGDRRPEGRLYASHLTRRGSRDRGWTADGTLVSAWPDGSTADESAILDLWMTATPAGGAIVTWNAWQHVPGYPANFGADQSFAMLLTPDGPAASPAGTRRSLAVPAVASESAPVTPPASPAFAIRGVYPNPARTLASLRFALPDARSAMLEMFDLSGRRVWSAEVGALGAGEHDVRLRDGAKSRPGVYLVRLSQGERMATARVVVVE